MGLNYFIAQEGQSLVDLSFMAYGSYDLLKLKKENPLISSFSFNQLGGKKIFYTPSKTPIQAYISANNKVFKTGIPVITNPNPKYLEQENGFDFLLEDNTGKIELE